MPLGEAPRRRPAARAEPLAGPAPETTFSSDLPSATTASGRSRWPPGPTGSSVAVLGSPFDPEAFVTWRADGIQVFFRGPAPARLDLRLDGGAFVTAGRDLRS